MKKKSVYTTGDIAEICSVAPRTVSKWFDSRRLIGYRIPGSLDRRVPHENLIEFLQSHQLPIPDCLKEEGAVAHPTSVSLNVSWEQFQTIYRAVEEKKNSYAEGCSMWRFCKDILKLLQTKEPSRSDSEHT